MSWKLAISITGGVAAILSAALLTFACAAQGHAGGTVRVGEFTVEAFIGNDGRTHWEGIGPNLCVCLEFFDKDGNPIGSGTISGGSGAGVVNGTVAMWRAKQIKCEDLAKCGQDSGGGGGSGGGGAFGNDSNQAASALASDPGEFQLPSPRTFSQPKPLWQRVWAGTVDIDETSGGGLIHNGCGEFDVLVDDPNSNEAFLAIWPILQAGPGSPVSPRVRVNFMSQCLPETFGGRLVFARRAPFESFVAHVNGVNNYAVLGQGVSDLSIGNDWHILEVSVPLSDIHHLPGEANTVEVFSRAIGEAALRHDSDTSILMP